MGKVSVQCVEEIKEKKMLSDFSHNLRKKMTQRIITGYEEIQFKGRSNKVRREKMYSGEE